MSLHCFMLCLLLRTLNNVCMQNEKYWSLVSVLSVMQSPDTEPGHVVTNALLVSVCCLHLSVIAYCSPDVI